MFKYRVLTALVLIPLVIYVLMTLSPQAFCLLTAIIVLVCAFEWSALMGIQSLIGRCVFLFMVAWVMLAAFWVPILVILYIALIFWLLASLIVIRYPKGKAIWGKGILIRGLMGFFVLVPCWLAINLIRNENNGVELVFFLFILIWGADTAAYFIGKKWGKHKILPEVSPGKTWEGLAGALLATFGIVLMIALIFKMAYSLWVKILILALITVLFSILGDLFESALKRNAGLKDSGRILPGHGGILDRLDSLTAAAPIFALVSMYISVANGF